MGKIRAFFKKSRFRSFLVIYSLVLLVLVGVSLFVFSLYLKVYEANLPQKVLDKFFEEADERYWHSLLLERFDSKVGEFEDKENVIEKLGLSEVDSEDLSCHKNIKEYTEETPVYTLRYKGREFAELRLKSEESDSFGVKKWKVDTVKLSFDDSLANDVKVTVTAPPEWSVTLNGKTLGKDRVTESRVDYPNISEFEQGMEGIPYRIRYTVDGLFDVPEIKVFGEDGAEELVDIDGYDYYAGSESALTKSISAVICDKYTLLVNGVPADKKYVVETGLPYTFLDGMDSYGVEYPNMVKYKISGFFFDPEVKAVDASGRELELVDDGSESPYFELELDENREREYASLAEEFVRAYIKYTADGRDNLQENHERVLSYTAYGSEADTVIRQSYYGVYWNNAYKVTYNELELYDFISYGDRAFSCKAKYDTVFSYYGIRSPKVGVFRMLFVNTGGAFKVVRLTNAE